MPSFDSAYSRTVQASLNKLKTRTYITLNIHRATMYVCHICNTSDQLDADCFLFIQPLTPSGPYRGRTAPLTSKIAFYIFIQQI